MFAGASNVIPCCANVGASDVTPCCVYVGVSDVTPCCVYVGVSDVTPCCVSVVTSSVTPCCIYVGASGLTPSCVFVGFVFFLNCVAFDTVNVLYLQVFSHIHVFIPDYIYRVLEGFLSLLLSKYFTYCVLI